MLKKKDVIDRFHKVNDRVNNFLKTATDEQIVGRLVMVTSKMNNDHLESMLEMSLMAMYMEDEIK